jgi:hypothetical protein
VKSKISAQVHHHDLAFEEIRDVSLANTMRERQKYRVGLKGDRLIGVEVAKGGIGRRKRGHVGPDEMSRR